jgi:hypothetical protein
MAQMIGRTKHGEKIHAVRRFTASVPWRTLCGLIPLVVDGQGTTQNTLVNCEHCLAAIKQGAR